MSNFLSTLEICHVIEQSFLPVRCVCQLSNVGLQALTIKIYDCKSDSLDLLITGVNLGTLNSNRAIVNLIKELRNELNEKRAVEYVNSSFRQL